MVDKMASTAKEKFDAAIRVIHSLPKDGPFQPSNEMMLTFYAYFKQATLGPCTQSKPNFWEVVKKAKWDAWNKLGDMEAEDAMLNYVDELKKVIALSNMKWKEMESNNDPRIVEAMPQTKVVGDFMETLGDFYELVDEDCPVPGVRIANHVAGDSMGGSPDQSDSSDQGLLENEYDMDISERVEISYMKDLQEREALRAQDVQGDTEFTAEKSDAEKVPLTNGDLSDFTESIEVRKDPGESRGPLSSDSEDEFCDTSDNPIQTEVMLENITKTVHIPTVDVQMSTPLKVTPKVRFADTPTNIPNGRISPILAETEYVPMASGYSFLQTKVNAPMSDSMIANAPDETLNISPSLSQVSVSRQDLNVTDSSTNNSNLYDVPRAVQLDEESEPPDDGRGHNQGQGPRQGQSGRSSQGSGSRMPSAQGSSGRHVLLAGGGEGAGGGGGQDPHEDPGPSDYDPVNQQIALVLVRLQQDMSSVLDRLNRLENDTRTTQREPSGHRRHTQSLWHWWPFSSRTGRTAFFVLVWPIIVHLVLRFLFRRRRR